MARPEQRSTARGRKHATVLVVEDERRYRLLIGDALRIQGYGVQEAEDGQSALEAVVRTHFDLVLLDLMLPDIDGFRLCERLRDFTQAPIIIVTGRADDRDKVRGLDGGADDYLTKPFSLQELLARVRAVLRRATERAEVSTGSSLRFGDLLIDGGAHRVMLGRNEIPLSPVEYRLLWFLAVNAGRVLVPEVIAERVWNASAGDVRGVLKTTIGRLREKLGDDPTNPTYICTRRGIGYLFAPDQGTGRRGLPTT